MNSRPFAFVVVGAGGFAVQIAMLALLAALGWPRVAATALSVEAAVLVNFFWHEQWTWRDRAADARGGSRGRRLLQFHASNGFVSIAGNVAVTLALTHAGIPLLVANPMAVVALGAWNYLAADRWVFASRVSSGAASSAPSSATSAIASQVPLACLAVLLAGSISEAAGPAPATVAAWQHHVAAIEADLPRHGLDKPLQEPSGKSSNVPDGTIYEWRASVLLPHTTVAQVVEALTNPGTPPPQEDVVASRVLAKDGLTLRVYLKLVRHVLVTVTYDTEHDVQFVNRSSDFATSRSISTKIAEADGGDRGFLWRLNSYWRYRQVGDDVQVDVLSVSLSRDIPFMVRAIAGPIANRIARESLVRTLQAMRSFMAQRVVEPTN